MASQDIGRATFLVSAGTIASRGIGFIASLIAAAVLAPAQFGAYGFMAATAALLSSLGVLGLSPLLTRAVASAKSAREASGAAKLALSAAVLALLAIAVIYGFVGSELGLGGTTGGPRNGYSAWVVAAWGLSAGLIPLMMAVLAGHREFRYTFRLTVVRAAFVAIATVGGAVETHDAVGASIGTVVAEAGTAAGCWAFLIARGWLSAPLRDAWKKGGARLLYGAFGSGTASLLVQGAMWGGQRMLIDVPGGYAENGGFLLAQRLTLIVTFLPSALATSSLPYLTPERNEAQTVRSRRRHVVQSTLAVSVPLAVICAAGGASVLHFVGGKYAPFWGTIAIMTLSGIVVALNNVLGTIAVAARRIRLWVFSDVVLAAVLISAALVAVSRWASVGLALAFALGYAASALSLIPTLRENALDRSLGVRVP